MRLCNHLVLAIFYWWSVSLLNLAAANDFSAMTLNGVRDVAVEVSGVRDEFARYGISADRLQTAIATQLQSAGFNVIDRNTALTQPDAKLIRMRVNTNQSQYHFWFYGITLELLGKAPLNNRAAGFTPTLLWTKGQTGVALPMELRKLNDIANELVAAFLVTHRAQNPGGIAVTDELH